MSRLEWRPTRLVAEDKERLVKLVIEEAPLGGWIWSATKGSRVRFVTASVRPRLTKDQAIEQAKRAAEEM